MDFRDNNRYLSSSFADKNGIKFNIIRVIIYLTLVENNMTRIFVHRKLRIFHFFISASLSDWGKLWLLVSYTGITVHFNENGTNKFRVFN